jgi:hypothetical protein
MKTRVSVSLQGLLGASLLALGMAGAQAFPSRAFFPMPPGGYWLWQVSVGGSADVFYDEQVVLPTPGYVNGAPVKTLLTPWDYGLQFGTRGERLLMTNDASGVRVHGLEDPTFGRVVFSPPFTHLAADASLGVPVASTGTYVADVAGSRASGTFNVTATPEAFEEVTLTQGLPGVTATALRVRVTGSLVGGPEEHTFEEVWWLTSGLGPVKFESSQTWPGEAPYTESGELLFTTVMPASRVVADLDGDARSDVVVFRPADGYWHALQSSTGFAVPLSRLWGMQGDLPQDGDFDGDGQADLTVYRPGNGTWYSLSSSSGFATHLSIPWGAPDDQPVARDYDGDGVSDIAVFRASEGQWFIRGSSSGFSNYQAIAWGGTDDIPVPADFDGDGRGDPAYFRPSNGRWYVKGSAGQDFQWHWGMAGDTPLAGDYDGDGRADLAVYRPAGDGTGNWYVALSSAGYGGFLARNWGAATDTPIGGDYDGDGRQDIGVYRAGNWYVLASASGYDPAAPLAFGWGAPDDVPLLAP